MKIHIHTHTCTHIYSFRPVTSNMIASACLLDRHLLLKVSFVCQDAFFQNILSSLLRQKPNNSNNKPPSLLVFHMLH